MIPRPENPLIAAIDVSTFAEAEALSRRLSSEVGMLKVGLELLWSEGPQAIRGLAGLAPVFADSKLHDIPNTVRRASANIASLGAAMFNVHALGGEAMMRAAIQGAEEGAERVGAARPLVIAVVVLSSQSGEELASPSSLAYEARASGLDGVVVSGDDVSEVRAVCGEDFCLVVPGIRPAGSNGHDQVRVLTPSEALEKGADYLVVGRPITEASDPVAAARGILSALR
jgi:orotidine-5'-phosphate decarboxylase